MSVDAQAVVRRCVLLRQLDDRALAAVVAAGHTRQVPAGRYLFHQDDPADNLYILIEGAVRLSQLTPEGHQVIVHHVSPGEGFGIIVALSNVAYPVSAETLEPCTLLTLDGATTKRLMLDHPQLALNGMDMVARHFVQISNRYRELATQRVERRVAHALLRLTRQVGRRTDAGILIDIPLSRQDLAEMTGTTLYTTSRILSQWERDGWITTGREQIVLVDPHAIVVIADDLPPDAAPNAD